jgi:hypothetical protein
LNRRKRHHLTAEERLRKTCDMRVWRCRIGATELKRLAALVSLLGVFFLPLHFHSLTAPAKLAKECACIQGTRTQLALIAPPLAHAALVASQPIIVRTSIPVSFEWPRRLSVRGPPPTLST